MLIAIYPQPTLTILSHLAQSRFDQRLYVSLKGPSHLNPRTDGGPRQLRTDGGGGYLPPLRSRKRGKLATSGKRHEIQVDKVYNFY